MAGVVVLARGRHHARTVDDARDGAEWSEIHDANQRANLLTGLGAGFSAAGLTTAAIGTWLVARRSHERRQQAHVLLSPRGAALHVRFEAAHPTPTRLFELPP